MTRRTLRRPALFYGTLPPTCVRRSIDGVAVWNCAGTWDQPSRGRYVVVFVD